MKRPDNIPDNGNENENQNGTGTGTDTGLGLGTGTGSRSKTRVIMRFIAFGILFLISIAVMALVIWINIRSRLN